jgi:hypothetical protein
MYLTKEIKELFNNTEKTNTEKLKCKSHIHIQISHLTEHLKKQSWLTQSVQLVLQ